MALKVPREGRFADREQEARFLREARSAGTLDHPGIVRVLDVGSCEGSHYIVSEYVPGVSLAVRLRQEPLAIRDAVTLVWQIAQALDHAHTRKVVHRDLKTANIILGDLSQPKLADFGMARCDQGETTVTADGKLLGTPGYMSPEQALGGAHIVDGRSDIYSLGTVLFELLTGTLPFRGTGLAVLHQVVHSDPPAPSTLVPSIGRDLETICLKCLEKSPSARYANACDLASDLRRWLDGLPVHARPVGFVGRLMRWAKRHRLIASLSALTVLLTLTTLAVLSYSVWQFYVTQQRLVQTSLETVRLATPEMVPRILRTLEPYDHRLELVARRELRERSFSSLERVRMHLVFSELKDYELKELWSHLLTSSPKELQLFCEVHRASLNSQAELLPFTAGTEGTQRLSNAALRSHARLSEIDSASVVDQLLDLPTHELKDWLILFSHQAKELRRSLEASFADDPDELRRIQAAVILAVLSGDHPDQLAQLFLNASSNQFQAMLPELQRRIDVNPSFRARFCTSLEARTAAGSLTSRANQLLLMGRYDSPARLLRELGPSENRSLRSLLIQRLPEVLGASDLLKELAVSGNSDTQHSLLISLARLASGRTEPAERAKIVDAVRTLGEASPRASVHLAASWFHERLTSQSLNWPLKTTSSVLADYDYAPNGHVMIQVSSEAGPEGFFLSAHEVSLRQFRSFRPSFSSGGGFGEVIEGPVVSVTAQDAADYCNWLSQLDSLPSEEWCYPPGSLNADGKFVGSPDYLRRKGYRLPTPEEWKRQRWPDRSRSIVLVMKRIYCFRWVGSSKTRALNFNLVADSRRMNGAFLIFWVMPRNCVCATTVPTWTKSRLYFLEARWSPAFVRFIPTRKCRL